MTKKIEHAGIAVPPEIMDELTRREFLIGAGLIALAPGCGNSGESGEETSANGRTIEHKFGTTEVPAEPRRVLSLGVRDHDTIFALGVEPIAVRYWFGDEDDVIYPWAEDAAGDADPEILNLEFGALNFERIAALEPDLILAIYSGIIQDEFETLSRIAPTVAQSGKYIDYGMPWDEATILMGEALGRKERAEELVGEVEGMFEAVREKHPQFEGATIVVANYGTPSEIGFRASQDQRSRFFTAMGFEVPEELDEIAGEEFAGTISGERLDLFDTDVLVWASLEFVEEGRRTIEADPLVGQLDAAREGRMLFLEDVVLDNALSWNTVLSLPLLLERVPPMLAAAVDGDPETRVEGAS